MTICGSLGPICVISDHCRVRIRVWVRVRVRVRIKVRFRFRVANCCIQTAGEGDKMRINHVIKTDQWRCSPQIGPAPHFVMSRLGIVLCLHAVVQDLHASWKLVSRYILPVAAH